MTGPVFVDTNVFVYRHDALHRAKQSRADEWIVLLAHEHAGRLSYQILQELHSTLTRTKRVRLNRADARAIVEALILWQPIPIDIGIMRRAWLIEDRYRLSWWDSLVVAAAQASECSVLSTEDLQAGQRFDDLRVVDPFADPDSTPRQVLETLL